MPQAGYLKIQTNSQEIMSQIGNANEQTYTPKIQPQIEYPNVQPNLKRENE